MELDTRGRAVRALFESRTAEHRQALSDELKKMGVDELAVDTHGDYPKSLRRFFHMREKRFR